MADFALPSIEGGCAACVEGDNTNLNWKEIEEVANYHGECARRESYVAKLLISVRDRAWTPLLLPSCPRSQK